jgi:hypothetical protein
MKISSLTRQTATHYVARTYHGSFTDAIGEIALCLGESFDARRLRLYEFVGGKLLWMPDSHMKEMPR